INQDGTVSRIHNWHAMTEAERERTQRVIAKRNQSRSAVLRKEEGSKQGDSRAKEGVE
ncbi:hypothetical protein FA10DRAFT_269686, partial [Acaromyces ingoldii]